MPRLMTLLDLMVLLDYRCRRSGVCAHHHRNTIGLKYPTMHTLRAWSKKCRETFVTAEPLAVQYFSPETEG